MNKLFKNLGIGVAALVLSLSFLMTGASPVQAQQAVAWGTRVGNVVTYVNNTNDVAQGYLDNYYTGGKQATFTASDNALLFSSGIHVTYTRVKVGYRWISVYKFDGYNLWLNVPANSTVTVTGSI